MAYRVGIDIGGTFTDFALLGSAHEDVRLYKNLTTPEDRSLGVMQGLERLAQMEGLGLGAFLGACDMIVHGTTVADNALIEMDGATTGLLCTEGFRDEMEYRRGFKEDIWDPTLRPPPQIVPRRRRRAVRERIMADGSVHLALDEDGVREECARLRKQGVDSVAIAMLFSFLNPEHERRTAEIVAEEMPGARISMSHRVLPRAPEYDRTSTTVVNAFVAPRVADYLERLVTRLEEAGYANRLMVMQASGGVMSVDYIEGAPVRVLASGPAGGVIGSAHVGAAKGYRDLLCVDMGGTSYDMSLVQDGAAPAEAGWNMHHRYLVGVPMVKVETLGAGGGSIVAVTGGVLRVGPESAGSVPGPICYGRGGTRPTVTDALLLLGILSDEEGFAGGDFALRRAGVEEAFAALGRELGKSAQETAYDAFRLVNANMVNGIRRTTASKGVDPAGLTMLAYGGNGPAFAAIQAGELGIARVLIPRASPTFSALGTLVADPTVDEERSLIAPVEDLPLERLRALWEELAARARESLQAAGFVEDEVTASWQLNMRYPGQNFALTFDVAHGTLSDLVWLDGNLGQSALALFNARHTEEYGHIREHELPEVTGVRLVSRAATPSPPVREGAAPSPRAAMIASTRPVQLGEGYDETPIVAGAALKPGDYVAGPAVIAETFTTIVVPTGWRAEVDAAGDYMLVRC
ncbi:hydantoinase/oxoprolinase family protein [Novosphingobium decolorationis]|uniref:Hydantoinase/oxoprolinase family protein n=1 Tax=Novosphingobium decolorationis TaxID=2698673 RepID=A0ABX8E6N4_9SPHN|nr:hydantoinase/oxoprolinase family protein [Novosphingobium decolorationis]QVM84684.1 hydantoinase/oxoprolinase family protein [Novosphingobium decolorationis]